MPRTTDATDPNVARGLDSAAAWSWRVLVVAGAAALGVFLFWQLRAFAIPLFIAVLFSTQMLPATRWLAGRGLPRAAAMVVVMLGLVVSLALLTVVIIGSFVGELDEIGAFVSQAGDDIADWAKDHDGPLHLDSGSVDHAAGQVGPALADAGKVLFGGVLGGASLLVELISGTVLALAFLIYLLTDGERVGAWLVRRFAPERRPNVERMALRGWQALGGYVRGVTLVALFDAVLIGAGLVVLGVPIAGSLTALVFLAAFVPIAGAWVSGAVCVAVALAGNGVGTAVAVLVIVLAVQEIESLVLDPIIYRRSVNLHPLATLAAVTAGGIVAGIIGALIAVPVVAFFWALLDEHDRIAEER
ncbi:MAG TPA: AI-2E family transporter [Baekduia sp.]|uniref:AI-2E family transporter n=1 Tax=Baekduia sp. TaxID=2600305 RepID=UPI002D77395D|nr:AI-2E family transporter [Baekduia sp.]HET6510274.1 AI-2E family transporter [Baekduia sp.]